MTTQIDAEMKRVKDFLYEDTTYKIRGACYKVWKHMGGAFKETAVDKALSKELRSQGLTVDEQKKNSDFI